MKSFQTMLSVRLPEEDLHKLTEMAILCGQSRSDVVRWMVTNVSMRDLPYDWIELEECVRRLRDISRN